MARSICPQRGRCALGIRDGRARGALVGSAVPFLQGLPLHRKPPFSQGLAALAAMEASTESWILVSAVQAHVPHHVVFCHNVEFIPVILSSPLTQQLVLLHKVLVQLHCSFPFTAGQKHATPIPHPSPFHELTIVPFLQGLSHCCGLCTPLLQGSAEEAASA